MAYSISTDVGYDVEIIGTYPPELNCGVCTLVLKKGMYGCQLHTFCQSCIQRHVQYGIRNDGNVKCPGGCGQIIDPTKLQPNYFADRMVNTLKTKCLNECCSWQGDLLDLVQVHQKSCEYSKIDCQNKGCNEMFLKKDLIGHENLCPYKLIQCNYCCNDIFETQKEEHEVKCLSDEIKCEYHVIGCNVVFNRKDSHSHVTTHQAQHTRLIFQHFNFQLSDCKKELLHYKNNLTQTNDDLLNSKLQVTEIKHENIELKEQFVKLKTDSSKEITVLKKQVKNINDELFEIKKLNFFTKTRVSNSKSESLRLKEEAEVNAKANKINSLKEKLAEKPALMDKITLVDNDNVVYTKGGYRGFDFVQLSKSYKERRFDYVINQVDLSAQKILLNEILLEVPYHMYQFTYSDFHDYFFCFPLDLKKIKQLDIAIPNLVNIIIFDNELLVNMDTVRCINLYVGKYDKKIKNGVKCSLNHFDDSLLNKEFRFANGYGCINFCVV